MTTNSGVGAEVLKSVQDMATRLHARSNDTVRLESVQYHAARAATLAEYEAGVSDGRRRLAAQYEALSHDCEDSKLALVGFSQGAQVVHEFSYGLDAEQAHNLVLVAMIADPRRNPDDTIAAWSYAKEPAPAQGKLGPGPRFGPSTREKAITLCTAMDEVCNRPDAGPPKAVSTTHKTFYEKVSTVHSTGRQLTAVLHRNGVG
ncbi:MAG: cutinase family protein [Actinomycetota bacterium]|nr:cutinase family protein [Actinomycetota bacterium]